jgi:hypothetical protein
LLLTACSGAQERAQAPVATPAPVATLIPTQPAPVGEQPSAEPALPQFSDSGWMDVGNGAELRRLRVPVGPGSAEATLTVVRLDTSMVRFRVGYQPGQPLAFTEWVDRSSPLAAINGGFFSEGFESTALVISGGAASGSSYKDSGGMFAVDSQGSISLRSLADQPYDPAEPLVEALQGWPMLVKPGGDTYSGTDADVARRSVVALDRSGHVLLLACSTSSFTLRALAEWLAASDLEIEAALNLDGGSSTGLYLSGQAQIDPFVRLPLVLLAEPR